jgi:hypothetical protein
VNQYVSIINYGGTHPRRLDKANALYSAQLKHSWVQQLTSPSLFHREKGTDSDSIGISEDLSPSLSPQERGTDSDSLSISEDLSPSLSPQEKGTDSDSIGISVGPLS